MESVMVLVIGNENVMAAAVAISFNNKDKVERRLTRLSLIYNLGTSATSMYSDSLRSSSAWTSGFSCLNFRPGCEMQKAVAAARILPNLGGSIVCCQSESVSLFVWEISGHRNTLSSVPPVPPNPTKIKAKETCPQSRDCSAGA